MCASANFARTARNAGSAIIASPTQFVARIKILKPPPREHRASLSTRARSPPQIRSPPKKQNRSQRPTPAFEISHPQPRDSPRLFLSSQNPPPTPCRPPPPTALRPIRNTHGDRGTHARPPTRLANSPNPQRMPPDFQFHKTQTRATC